MAPRVSPVAIPAPVAELVEAWNTRSADRFAAALASDARVVVPPLHLELRGRDEAWDGVARLFAAFGALRYTSRHRYLSPDAVTDEVLLEGLQTREFLGAPPPGRPGAVAARVMMRHDARQVTELTVWPDVAALRELSAGVARRIDLRSAGAAAPVVAALRATIPSGSAKLSVGHERELADAPPPEEATLLPGAPPVQPAVPDHRGGRGGKGTGKGSTGKGSTGKGSTDKGSTDKNKSNGTKDGRGKDKAGPKAPLPRKAQRRRAVAAGVLMLGLAGALGAYVVQGVKGAKSPVAAAVPARRPAASPTTSPGGGAPPSPNPSASRSTPASVAPAPSATFDSKKNTYNFNNKILFELNSFTLRTEARQELRKVASRLTSEKRFGTVHVKGYTDNTGTVAYNRTLSLQRAQVVGTYLRGLLRDPGFTVLAEGFGEDDPAASNDTPAGQEQNRRVEIVVPKPSS